MGGHLLIVSLGPIQDFIASARRCQDLWFGSWLLSDLSRAAASGIEAAAGVECLIFPGSLSDDETSVANKIVAMLPEATDPAHVARCARDALAARRDALAKRAFDRIHPVGFHRDVAEKQVADLIEYIWVAVPAADGYAAARQAAERLLAFRKNTRDWSQVPWHREVGTPKSSLDGLRESVLDDSLYGDRGVSDEARRKRYFVKKSERLCGVGVLKRVGTELDVDDGDEPAFLHSQPGVRPAFHSTSHVAAAPLLVRIARRGVEAQRAVGDYLDALVSKGLHAGNGLAVDIDRFVIRSGLAATYEVGDPIGSGTTVTVGRTLAPFDGGSRGRDGYLLFEDRLREIVETYSSTDDLDASVRRARRALGTLLGVLGVPRPQPYYAVLLADGDRMGKAIDELARRHSSRAQEKHRELSRALDGFALACRGVVEARGGSLVYAGGDDVLALVPLHTALGCANALRELFADRVAAVCHGISAPTLSVGLGIAHHLDRMDDARALAKEAESLAKRARDSLGIVVQKRSGGALRLAARWSEKPHERIDRWCQLFRQEELPDGVAYELEDALAPLEPAQPGTVPAPADLSAVAAALARRIIGRKRRERGAEAIDTDVAALLGARFHSAADPLAAVRELSAELQIARVFLAAYEDAWGGAP